MWHSRYMRPSNARASKVRGIAVLSYLLLFLSLSVPLGREARAAGKVWISVGPGEGSIYAPAVDPQNPANLYAGTSDGGVFRSASGGTDWSATGLTNTVAPGLAIDPQSPATLYAGTDGGSAFRLSTKQTWETDADGRAAIGVWRPGSGVWHTLPSKYPGQ